MPIETNFKTQARLLLLYGVVFPTRYCYTDRNKQINFGTIEENIDAFYHGKEEKAYFLNTRSKKQKDSFLEDVRKSLIEHELGRKMAIIPGVNWLRSMP